MKIKNKLSPMLIALFALILIPFGVSAEEAVIPGQVAGDNAWMLTSTALVLLMTIPGVAYFCGNMCCYNYMVYNWL